MIGVLCLIFVDYKYVWLGIILIGVASGLAFGLANTLFVVRTESGQTAAKLSGMAQSIGYLLAAIGPFLFGIFHDITHNWTLSLSVWLLHYSFFYSERKQVIKQLLNKRKRNKYRIIQNEPLSKVERGISYLLIVIVANIFIGNNFIINTYSVSRSFTFSIFKVCLLFYP